MEEGDSGEDGADLPSEPRSQSRSGRVSLLSLLPRADAVHADLGAQGLDEPVWVMGNPALIEGLVSNLVDNALRYSPRGGSVELRARRDAESVTFEVRDSGPGIAAEHQAQLFERFYRVPGSPTGGAGLGLYICREIVEAHGGHIGVESEPGKGAGFWFTLPVVEEAAGE